MIEASLFYQESRAAEAISTRFHPSHLRSRGGFLRHPDDLRGST
ncbi:MAG: hypothetical protein ACE5KV_00010 [Thermoplasmata archaeon]